MAHLNNFGPSAVDFKIPSFAAPHAALSANLSVSAEADERVLANTEASPSRRYLRPCPLETRAVPVCSRTERRPPEANATPIYESRPVGETRRAAYLWFCHPRRVQLFPTSCPLSTTRERYADNAAVAPRPPQSPPRDTLRPRSPPDGVALEHTGVRRKYRHVRSARRRPTDPERRHHHAPLTSHDGVYAWYRGARTFSHRQRLGRAMGTLGDGQDAGEHDGSRDSSVTLVLASEIPPRRRLQSTARRIARPRPSDTARSSATDRPRSRRCSRPQTPGAPSESRCALDSRRPVSRVPREHKARGGSVDVVRGEAASIDA
ncbi:hypothetical protein VTO73DRAFT_12315 [Trametes versicolor]